MRKETKVMIDKGEGLTYHLNPRKTKKKEYRLRNSEGELFFVQESSQVNEPCKYEIRKKEHYGIYCVTLYNVPWCKPPIFDSFIQAIRYLKENIENLL